MTHSAVIEADDATMLSSKRDFHNDKDSTYWLPKDKEEKSRLIRVRDQSFFILCRSKEAYLEVATLCYKGYL